MRMLVWVVSTVVATVWVGQAALAQGLANISNSADLLPNVGSVVLVFLVLAVVFESAMTPIFNSRFYARYLEGKGWKVPLTVALAFAVFYKFDLDIIRDLLNVMKYEGIETVADDGTVTYAVTTEPTFAGQLLTALLIAGGSSGIFQIFTKLGIRNPTQQRQKAATERRTSALEARGKANEAQTEYQSATAAWHSGTTDSETKQRDSDADPDDQGKKSSAEVAKAEANRLKNIMDQKKAAAEKAEQKAREAEKAAEIAEADAAAAN